MSKNKNKLTGRERLNITNVWIDPVDTGEAARVIKAIVEERRRGEGGDGGGGTGGVAQICTPNAEFMMCAQGDRQFMRILNDADLVVADGAGVVLAARLLGYGRIARAPGYDLAKALVSNPSEFPYSFYFLGGKPGIAEKAAANILYEYPGVNFTGWHDGYFKDEEEPLIIDEINQSGAEILFVALGSPKAEKFIYRNRHRLKAFVCMGVGGTIDIFAGEKKSAPPFFRSHGLEWLYRLYCEPWRAKRMLRLPQYVLYTVWWRMTGRKAK